jgi:hypothetical protein
LWGRTEADIEPCQGKDHQHGRGDEAETAEQQTRPTRAQITNVDRHFGRVGTRDEIGRSEQIEELFVGQPLATHDDLIVHEPNVRGWSAEGGQAELEEERGNFCKAVHEIALGMSDDFVVYDRWFEFEQEVFILRIILCNFHILPGKAFDGIETFPKCQCDEVGDIAFASFQDVNAEVAFDGLIIRDGAGVGEFAISSRF